MAKAGSETPCKSGPFTLTPTLSRERERGYAYASVGGNLQPKTGYAKIPSGLRERGTSVTSISSFFFM